MADRVHRRAELRDPRPRRLRPSRLGAAARARRRPRGPPVRGGGAADHAAGEGPPHRRPGHRRADHRLSAGPGWVVKLDKDDFVGRPELAWQHERGDGSRLVGLQPVDGSSSARGRQIVAPAGRSSAGSPPAGCPRPSAARSASASSSHRLAAAGTEVHVRLTDGGDAATTVMAQHAHFDPEGTRLHG